jgi:ribosomal protein S10
MNNLSTFVEQVTTVERPATNNRSDGDFEMITYHRENNHNTDQNKDISDPIQ